MSLFMYLLSEPLHGERDEDPFHRHESKPEQGPLPPFPYAFRTDPDDEPSTFMAWLSRLRRRFINQ